MKRHAGFTLIEVLISLGIIAAFAAIFLRQQARSVDIQLSGSERIPRAMMLSAHLQKILYRRSDSVPRPFNVEAPDPEMKVYTAKLSIQKKSALGDFRDDCSIMKVTGEWGDQQLSLIGFVMNEETGQQP